VWLEPFYQVTLASVEGSGDKKESNTIGNKFVQFSDRKGVEELLDAKSASEARTKFSNLVSYDPFLSIPSLDQLLKPTGAAADRYVVLSETCTNAVLVDYGNPLYLNSNRPLIGNASASAELNADGTLSKGSAQVESKTVQAFLDLLPISKLISTAAGAPAFAAAETLRISVTHRFLKHTASKTWILEADKKCHVGAQAVDNTYNYTTDEMATFGLGKEKDDKADRTVSVSGSVVLPKKQ